MKFNEKLIAQRKEKALTQEELAEMLGVTRQAVSRWETGETTPEMPLLAKLCRVFGVSADYLINDDINDSKKVMKGMNHRKNSCGQMVAEAEPERYFVL